MSSAVGAGQQTIEKTQGGVGRPLSAVLRRTAALTFLAAGPVFEAAECNAPLERYALALLRRSAPM